MSGRFARQKRSFDIGIASLFRRGLILNTPSKNPNLAAKRPRTISCPVTAVSNQQPYLLEPPR
jgi:hypothetical protein